MSEEMEHALLLGQGFLKGPGNTLMTNTFMFRSFSCFFVFVVVCVFCFVEFMVILVLTKYIVDKMNSMLFNTNANVIGFNVD